MISWNLICKHWCKHLFYNFVGLYSTSEFSLEISTLEGPLILKSSSYKLYLLSCIMFWSILCAWESDISLSGKILICWKRLCALLITQYCSHVCLMHMCECGIWRKKSHSFKTIANKIINNRFIEFEFIIKRS